MEELGNGIKIIRFQNDSGLNFNILKVGPIIPTQIKKIKY